MLTNSDEKAANALNPAYVGIRHDMLARIPEFHVPQYVLEVGCSEGATGASLKTRYPQCHVTGIELDRFAAEQASVRLDDIRQGDAAQLLAELAREIKQGKRPPFDTVFCGDVLEHLIDPWGALRAIRDLCTGYTIVSLPNVAHISNLTSLFFRSDFPYRDRGVQDRTHLRFFARRNLPDLFAQAEFEEVSRFTHHRIIERPHFINRKLAPILRYLPLISRLTEYQFISVLK